MNTRVWRLFKGLQHMKCWPTYSLAQSRLALIYKHETHTFVWHCYASTKRIVYASFGAAIQARNACGRLALIFKHEAASIQPPSTSISFATTVSSNPPPLPFQTSTLCHRNIHHLPRRRHSRLRRCIRPRHTAVSTTSPPLQHPLQPSIIGALPTQYHRHPDRAPFMHSHCPHMSGSYVGPEPRLGGCLATLARSLCSVLPALRAGIEQCLNSL